MNIHRINIHEKFAGRERNAVRSRFRNGRASPNAGPERDGERDDEIAGGDEERCLKGEAVKAATFEPDW